MIDFPTTSSVAVQAVRPLLRRIARVYKSAGTGQWDIDDQLLFMGYNAEHALDVRMYPAATHPSAQAVRKDILDLARMLHRASDSNRLGIAAQINAMMAYLGAPFDDIHGTSGAGSTPPITAEGKYKLALHSSADNIGYVNWFINSVPVPGVSARELLIAPTDYPQLVWAEVYSLNGTNLGVSWTIPGKLDVPGTLVVAAGDASHPTEVGYRDTLFGDLVPTAVYGGDIRLLIATQSSGQIALGFVTSIGRDTIQVTIDGTTLEMVSQDQITFYADDTTVWDRIRNGIGDTLDIMYIGGTEGIPARSAPRVHALEDVKGLTKTELVALLSGE